MVAGSAAFENTGKGNIFNYLCGIVFPQTWNKRRISNFASTVKIEICNRYRVVCIPESGGSMTLRPYQSIAMTTAMTVFSYTSTPQAAMAAESHVVPLAELQQAAHDSLTAR